VATSRPRKAGPGETPRDDLKDDPGIGASKGAAAGKADPDLIKGDNTFEGDVENDTTRFGGVDPRQLGRTNR
jgi:hypothetical protein